MSRWGNVFRVTSVQYLPLPAFRFIAKQQMTACDVRCWASQTNPANALAWSAWSCRHTGMKHYIWNYCCGWEQPERRAVVISGSSKFRTCEVTRLESASWPFFQPSDFMAGGWKWVSALPPLSSVHVVVGNLCEHKWKQESLLFWFGEAQRPFCSLTSTDNCHTASDTLI